MQSLVHRTVRFIQRHQLLQTGDAVIAAVSGGVDSTALLHILASCGLHLQITAVYIDHGLRPDEVQEELHFTRQLAGSLNIEHLFTSVNVHHFHKEHGCSPEEAARTLRYKALDDIRDRKKARVIAVGHTADDQVEEFFIRLIRGSGLKGLSGMSCKRDNIIRPLLDESRATLLAYIKEHNLGHCHDSSNEDRRFLRNRIRLDLLPELENHYNPAIRTNILQTTAILAQEEALLEAMTDKHFRDLCTIIPAATSRPIPDAVYCKRADFTGLHPAMQRRILETICWKMCSRPTFRQIKQMTELIGNGTPGARLHLQSGLRIAIDAKAATFSHPQGRKAIRGEKTIRPTDQRLITSAGSYNFQELGRRLMVQAVSRALHSGAPDDQPPGTLLVDASLAVLPLTVRPPLPGETMRPLGAPGKKKISRIFNDLKLPEDKRPNYPLVVSGNEPVAILGLRIADWCKITDSTTNLLVLSWQDIDNSPE